ncbi:MAG TPA: hypothetical protein VGO50_04385 [Pyrinomonadaceae bacterium]|jgi:hypothetical protein|nr:hypothetical protein [Pyrinomonadaceae bacterium]
MKKLLLSLFFLLMGALAVYAQSSCSCSLPNGCSASQSCPPKYLAICTCNPSGCSSSCQKETGGGPILLGEGGRLANTLRTAASEKIGGILSRAYAVSVAFEPRQNFSFELQESKSAAPSDWDILEYLDGSGVLTINGQKLEFWKGIKDNFIGGGELTICVGGATVDTVLRQLAFVSGKQFSVTIGDSQTIVNGAIHGNGIKDFLETLGKMGHVTIIEK